MPTEMGNAQGRITIDTSSLKAMPQVAREAGRATARELQNALKEADRQRAAAERQRTAGLQAALTHRRVAIRAAAREEVEVTRQAAAQQAAADRQRLAELKATLRQRVIAVKAAAREEAEARRAAAAQQQAFGRGAATFAGAALGGPIGGLAGALAGGAPALAAGLAVSQGARFALEATQTATAYSRQTIAAQNLAGSQGKLNSLMVAYDKATGGAVDKAASLSNVTRLMAVGFANSAADLTRFTTGVRGASIAMGKMQDEISQEVQLAISNTSFRRLDQIGLGIAEVNERMGQLRAQNQGMTREAAFQEAVLGLLNDKYGALAKSAEGQATGVEKATKATKDMSLAVGQILGPTVNLVGDAFADYLDLWNARMGSFVLLTKLAVTELQKLGLVSASGMSDPASRTSIGRVTPEKIYAGQVGLKEDQLAAINRWDASKQDISRQASQASNDETRQAGQQRVSIIANYEKSIVREAEDFGRQRQNAERKHALAILDVAQDSARQRVKWERDLARSIADAQADSAERIDDARKDANKRLAELDKDFKRDQERREEEYRDDMLKAAGQLDAIALLELRKGRARELEDAKEAHKEQRDDLQEQLRERIDEERENLAESIDQQREAHQRQLDEQRENDALRLQEMQEAFAEQRVQEDTERGIRLGRQAEDHAQQLAEFDRAHAERITQIQTNAAKERAQLDEEFQKEMDALGIRTKAYEARELAREKSAIASFDRYFEHMERRFDGRTPRESLKPGHLRPYADGGWVDRTGAAKVHAGEFVLSRAMLNGGFIPPEVRNAVTDYSRSITIAAGAITVNAAPGQDNAQLVNMLDNWLVSRLESV